MRCRSSDESFIKIEEEMSKILDSEFLFTNYLFHFLKMLRCGGCDANKEETKQQPDKIIFI